MDFILTCLGKDIKRELTGPVFSFTLPIPSGTYLDVDVGKT